VARSFWVNEKHLSDAVWYLKENRQRKYLWDNYFLGNPWPDDPGS